MALDPIEKYLGENKELLNENIGGVVSIGAINNLFDRKKEKYEDAFEHFLSERYGYDPDSEQDDEDDQPDWEEDDTPSYPSHPTDGSPEDTSMPSWMMEDNGDDEGRPLGEDMYSLNDDLIYDRMLDMNQEQLVSSIISYAESNPTTTLSDYLNSEWGYESEDI